MPIYSGKYSILKSIYSKALNITVYSVVIVGMNSTASAGILVEGDDGKMIAIEGGVLNYQPSSSPNALANTLDSVKQASASPEDKAQRTRFSSVLGQEKSGPNLLSRSKYAAKLPAPRKLSNLKSHQHEMFRLASNVGSRFAFRPEVRAANLTEEEFVAYFTTMIHRESNFKANAVSPVGAQGLGQLMPATAKELGVKNSFAPEENLEGAATYLTSMLGEFGSIEMALAAYNAGPGAVKKHKGIPPFRETRQYVADIMHNSSAKMPDVVLPTNTNYGLDRSDSLLAYDAASPATSKPRIPNFEDMRR